MVVYGSGFSHSFWKILNGYIIKCETKTGIVHNFEVDSFMRDIYQIKDILSDISTYRSNLTDSICHS